MATIHDVARLAGVSTSTVSRVLSRSRAVHPESEAKVLAAAEELGYRHNAVARALRTSRSHTIGMLVPQISNPFFPALVEAVERRLDREGLVLFLCDSQRDAEVEARRLLALVDRQVDGVIITPFDATASVAAVRGVLGRLPVIQAIRCVEGSLTDWVGVDDETGFRLLVDHLVAAGRRRLVFVSAAPETNSSAQRRLDAVDAALRAHGLTAAQEPLLGRFEVDWGLDAAERVDLSAVDGIVCGNDAIALGMLRGLRRAGVSVPGQVAVTGFDDISYAEISDPPLTTVRQEWDALADACVRLLLHPSDDGPRCAAIAPTLQVRESTPSLEAT
ncbi:LacI family DNA-binding transcriptional regulator [Prauserella cavernicola]|uniref:LacI family DNA-binding transcriptional regulator n=1 Tax=Prauserella cavernicola TaxID=2800127 RepID=A0A934QP38_9PSEU|nr:LacI family DNA-binding transcriptional regulator [Prauserella cavernicola]MBK1784191.1 LacI family DNA-binding transcriptional regulator [Prauserella cavernicola]